MDECIWLENLKPFKTFIFIWFQVLRGAGTKWKLRFFTPFSFSDLWHEHSASSHVVHFQMCVVSITWRIGSTVVQYNTLQYRSWVMTVTPLPSPMTVMTANQVDSYWLWQSWQTVIGETSGREGCPSRHTVQINNTAFGHSIERVSKGKHFLSLLKMLVVERKLKKKNMPFLLFFTVFISKLCVLLMYPHIFWAKILWLHFCTRKTNCFYNVWPLVECVWWLRCNFYYFLYPFLRLQFW